MTVSLLDLGCAKSAGLLLIGDEGKKAGRKEAERKYPIFFGVGCVAAVTAAGGDYADWGFLLFHDADLHRRSLRAQQHLIPPVGK